MRPPKRIAIWDSREIRRSVTICVLQVRGYRIAEPGECCDLIAIWDPAPAGDQLSAIYATARSSACAVLLVGKDKEFPCDSRMEPRASMTELLERIHILSARKRGPRKGTPRKPVKSHIVEPRAGQRIA